MQSPVAKRSVIIDGHKTSVSVEDIFWTSLKEVARERAMTLSKLIGSIDAERVAGANLSSAIRVYLLERFRTQLENTQVDPANARRLGLPLLSAGGR
jgi:predicted DNA-binding ribbon-helix-helix protein